MSVLRIVVSLYWLAIYATGADQKSPASDAADPYASIRAAMQSSVAKQKASVRTQVEHAQTAPGPLSSTFFTVPWPAAAVPLVVADCDPLPATELEPLIRSSAERHGVKAELIRAIIQKESSAKPCAVSIKGAQGLMQLMPATAADFDVRDPFDPKQNVDAGTRFLKSLLERFKGDLSLALGAYNAGAAAVEKAGGIPQNAETKDYVPEITRSLSQDSAPSGETRTSPETKAP